MSIMQSGWTLMGLGLLGVFGALILFYGFIRLLLYLGGRSKSKDDKSEGGQPHA